MVSVLLYIHDLSCSAISDVVKDWLSIISSMKMSFTGESLGAISSGSTRVQTNKTGNCEVEGKFSDERAKGEHTELACMAISCKIRPSQSYNYNVKYRDHYRKRSEMTPGRPDPIRAHI